jgi:hypothetical protein
MTLADFLIFLFASAGLTFTIVHATIVNKLGIRQLLNKHSFTRDLIKCSLCTGFWVSTFFSLLFFPSYILLLSFAGSAFSFLFERTTIFLDEKIQEKTKHE